MNPHPFAYPYFLLKPYMQPSDIFLQHCAVFSNCYQFHVEHSLIVQIILMDRIRRKRIQILSTPQPNRVLIHKPTHIRLIISEEVVMQPRLTVDILVLQSERLVQVLVNPLIFFQMTPAGVVAEP